MADPQLVLVSGKGGVGKSAVAAAIALASHRRGRRVLAIAMTGHGDGLAAHLGAAPLTFALREERPGLSTAVVDRTKALVEYLHVRVGIPQLMAFGPALKAFDALASGAPAVREIVTMGKVLWEVRRGEWDVVVADAPPTGQLGSFLRAPRSIQELVPVGKIRDQAEWMESILLDADSCRLDLVTTPEELPTTETLETLEWIRREQVVGRCDVTANRVLHALETAGPLPAGRAGDAARLHLSIQNEQAIWLETLPPAHRLPFLFGMMTPTEVAARLADEVESWA